VTIFEKVTDGRASIVSLYQTLCHLFSAIWKEGKVTGKGYTKWWAPLEVRKGSCSQITLKAITVIDVLHE